MYDKIHGQLKQLRAANCIYRRHSDELNLLATDHLYPPACSKIKLYTQKYFSH